MVILPLIFLFLGTALTNELKLDDENQGPNVQRDKKDIAKVQGLLGALKGKYMIPPAYYYPRPQQQQPVPQQPIQQPSPCTCVGYNRPPSYPSYGGYRPYSADTLIVYPAPPAQYVVSTRPAVLPALPAVRQPSPVPERPPTVQIPAQPALVSDSADVTIDGPSQPCPPGGVPQGEGYSYDRPQSPFNS